MRSIFIPWYLKRARHPFKKKVVGRWWGWLSRYPVWIAYDGDLLFRANLRDYVQQKVFYDGYYEPHVVQWLKDTLRPGDVFWDVGANVGAMTLVAARRCERVYAFEPAPATRAHLEVHIAQNRLANVSVEPFALADQDGTARFTLAHEVNSGMHGLGERLGGAGAIDVLTRRADTLVREGRVAPPNVMKVDVEGAELLVFRGAGSLLHDEALRSIVFEAEMSDGGQVVDPGIGKILRDAGFHIARFGDSDPDVPSCVTNFVAMRS